MSVSVTLCVVVPSVAALRVNPRMAWLAQRDEVGAVVRPSLRERQLVVYLLGLCIDPFLKTELTQRVGSSVSSFNLRIAVLAESERLHISPAAVFFLLHAPSAVKAVGWKISCFLCTSTDVLHNKRKLPEVTRADGFHCPA